MRVVFGTDYHNKEVVKDIIEYPVILICGNAKSGKEKLVDGIVQQASFPEIEVVNNGEIDRIKSVWREIKRRYELFTTHGIKEFSDDLGLSRILLNIGDVEQFGDSYYVTDILQRISVFGAKSGVNMIVSASKATSINPSLRIVSSMKICGATDRQIDERIMLDGGINWYSELVFGEFIMNADNTLTRFKVK